MNLASTAQSFISWLSKQSIARLFAFTRQLEREILSKEAQLDELRKAYIKAGDTWHTERNALLDRLLEKQGLPSAFDTIKREPQQPPNPYAGLPPRQRAIAIAQGKEMAEMRAKNGSS